jgi:hypothetical protein
MDVIHFVLGKINPVLSHVVSARRTQFIFGSIFRKAAASFCSVISFITSMIICLVLDSCLLRIHLYNRFIISSKVLSVVKTQFEINKSQVLLKREKKSQILSSGLYLV